jgi:hypothetical protein
VEIRRYIDIGRAEKIAEFRELDKAIVKDDVLFHAEFSGKPFETLAVFLAAVELDVGMRRTYNDIDRVRILLHDCREGFYHHFDSLVRGKESEG